MQGWKWMHKSKRRRRRPAEWMPAGNAPEWETARISFRKSTIRTGSRLTVPMAILRFPDGLGVRFYPIDLRGETVYGLALRAHRLERQARRDAARIRRLEAQLAAVRRVPEPTIRRYAEALLGLGGQGVPEAGSGWSFRCERDAGKLALAPVSDADLAKERRRA